MGTFKGVEPQRYRYTVTLSDGRVITRVCSLQRFIESLPPELGIKYATVAKNACSFTHKGHRFERKRIIKVQTTKEIAG